MVNVLLLGASGFLGQSIAHKLQQNPEIDLYFATRSKSKLKNKNTIHLSFSEKKQDLVIKLQKFNVVINCIGELSNEDNMEQVNFGIVKTLVDSITEYQLAIRLIQVSSVGCYGAVGEVSNTKLTLVNERSKENPKGLYEVTKTQADDYIKKYAITNKSFSYTILRPTNVYGLNMKSAALRQLAKMVRKGWFIFIGSANAISTYIHVDDVANGVALSIKKYNCSENQTFILSDDCEQKLLIDALANYYGVKPPQIVVPIWLVKLFASVCNFIYRGCPLSSSAINSLASKVTFSSQKIRDKLGFIPFKSIHSSNELPKLLKYWS